MENRRLKAGRRGKPTLPTFKERLKLLFEEEGLSPPPQFLDKLLVLVEREVEKRVFEALLHKQYRRKP